MSQGIVSKVSSDVLMLSYTIDGKNWNLVSKEFKDENDALDFIKKNEMDAWSTNIRLLVVSKTISSTGV